MTRSGRVFNFIWGLFVLILGVLIAIDPWHSYGVVVFFLSLYLLIYGIRTISYYFTLARHMVGGRISFYKGIILLDMAFLSFAIADVPRIYVMLYLVVLRGFSGIVDILRAVESRQYGGKGWKIKLFFGIVNFGLAVMCLFTLRTTVVVGIIYGIGLISSGLVRISSSMRKTQNVYVNVV